MARGKKGELVGQAKVTDLEDKACRVIEIGKDKRKTRLLVCREGDYVRLYEFVEE